MSDFDKVIKMKILPYLQEIKKKLDSFKPGGEFVWAEFWEEVFVKTRGYFTKLREHLPLIFDDFPIREVPKKGTDDSRGDYYKMSPVSLLHRDVNLAVRYLHQYLAELEHPTAKVFISHGPPTTVLPRVEQFVRDLGLIPIVAEWTASEGREIRPDTEKKIRESSCAIILAEKDPDDPKGKNPRGNVLIESEHAKLVLGNKLIWLKEEGVEWPSLDRAIIWESFTKECLEKAFAKIVRELRAFDLLR